MGNIMFDESSQEMYSYKSRDTMDSEKQTHAILLAMGLTEEESVKTLERADKAHRMAKLDVITHRKVRELDGI